MYNIHSRPKDDQSDDEYIGILNSPKLQTTATKNDSDLIMQHQVIEDLEQRQKLTVFGYTRQRAGVFIPIEIIKLFVAFYKSQDDWDRIRSHSSIEVDDDYIATATSGLWCIGFGEDTVKSRIKEWVLKLFQIDSAIIGIVPSDQIHIRCNSGDYTNHNNKLRGYGLCGSNGVFYSLGDGSNEREIGSIRSKDVVVMRLDVSAVGKKGILSYKINDGEYKEATNSISVDESWSLAVAFYGRGKVQLLK